MKKIIKLTEAQSFLLLESLQEGLKFKRDKNNPNNRIISYVSGENSKIDDTIFNTDNTLKVHKVLLPKSGVLSYNLYNIKDMNVNKSLKHNIDLQRRHVVRDDKSMTIFINRSVLLIKHIIGDRPVDIITYPQSSSKFNYEITNKLLQMFPNSEGIKLTSELLVKNIRNVFVNVDAAKSVGLTDIEIQKLQKRVEKWRGDEDIRDIRRKIDELQNEILDIISIRGKKRGRLPNDIVKRQEKINMYNQDIKQLRKGKKGLDPTINVNTGKVKDWQIKSIDDRERRSLEGIFTLNPKYQYIQYKLKNKNIIIFDDNMSSGATMDDICLSLQKLGVASIMPFTLGIISPTLYNPSQRNKYNL